MLANLLLLPLDGEFTGQAERSNIKKETRATRGRKTKVTKGENVQCALFPPLVALERAERGMGPFCSFPFLFWWNTYTFFVQVT